MLNAVYVWLATLGLCVGVGSGCGTEVVKPPLDASVVIKVETDFIFCSKIGGIDVFPLEVWVASDIELHAIVEEGSPRFTWHASSGSFSDPSAADTRYTCTRPGDHSIAIAIDEGTACEDSRDLEITCSRNPACGNGRLDPGEQCDDGATEWGDGCSDTCRFEVN